MRKNEFWWLIWACHRHFSRYRVFKRQNWIKILVFTIFFLGYFTTILLQIKMAKFRKKSLNFGSGQQNCSIFFACDLTRTLNIYPIKITFRSYRFEDDFTRFIYLFELTKKLFFFCLFSKWKFYGFGLENHSEQVHILLSSDLSQLELLLMTFEKWVFSRFCLNFFFQIKKCFFFLLLLINLRQT